jgi:flagellin-like protein
MKAMKKNVLGVSPVIAVILMVAITVVLAGVVFLWAQSFTDEAGGGGEILNVKASIDVNGLTGASGGPYSLVTVEVISGSVDWSQYKITVDGVQIYDVATLATNPDITNGESASAGDSEYFSIAAWSTPLAAGTEYNVKIVNIGENALVWEDDIIATA